MDILIESFLNATIPKTEFIQHVEDLTEKAHNIVNGDQEVMEWFVIELKKRLQEL